MRRAAIVLALVLFLVPAAADPPSLEQRLASALGARALRGARVGAVVMAAEDGRVLFSRDAEQPLIPASNMKILTAIAALERFGPTHRFATHVFADALPDDEGAVGWLAVRGGGDPGLTSEDYWRLAADLGRAGVRHVGGELVLDATLFDDQWWHPSWGAISARAYHAPVGALTANYGAYSLSVVPASVAGGPVRVVLDPPAPYLRVANRATTGPRRSRRRLGIDRRAADGIEWVSVSGSLPAGSAGSASYRSVLDPTRYAGAVLRLQLEANGIDVAGGTRVASVPEDAQLLLAHQGRPLAEIVRRFMKHSNNAMGEGLVKALAVSEGHVPGSWEQGEPALARALAGAGVSTDGLTLVDGSGLSYANRVTARSLAEALRRAERSFRFGPEFVASLPIAGGDGTLRERAEGAALRVRAKTGLLTRVTALSGYAELADGKRAVFSILVNGYRVGAAEAMDAVDGFVEALASSSLEE